MKKLAAIASMMGMLLLAADAGAQARRGAGAAGGSRELMLADDAGLLRWRSNNTEVSLSGGNYALPSGEDYRAVTTLGADIKKTIDTDMYHLIRIGWNALRIPFAGDWECSDKQGNLIDNPHLDALDYLIKSAGDRDQHIILVPIVGYGFANATVPGGTGFSSQFKREELTTNPEAIAAQVNFIKQLLNHVNRYNNQAYKSDTRICLLELVHEPTYPASDDATTQYINTLMDALREIGCTKPTFFGLGANFEKMKAVGASKADGISFGWNATGAGAGRQLKGNYLRTVDAFPAALASELPKKARIVYDFDMPGVNDAYHLAAMVRNFRAIGVQFSTMSDYDSIATAPHNLTTPASYLNVVYTPQKAIASNVALQVGRQYPINQSHGEYPDNLKFGEFRVSYEENLSERANNLMFIYSNDTKTTTPSLPTLTKIAGFGSSPLVQYEGRGAYFLDKLAAGAWRLEVYPDAIQIGDPIAGPIGERPVARLIWHAWPMTVALPELGQSFKVEPQNEGNTYKTQAVAGKFTISPGTYLLTNADLNPVPPIPEKILNVPYRLGTTEFFCPPSDQLPMNVVVSSAGEYTSDQPITITATVADAKDPSAVELQMRRSSDTTFKSFPMLRVKNYDYRATIPAGTFPEGSVQYQISVSSGGTKTFTAPGTANQPYAASIVSTTSPIVLFDPSKDLANLDASLTTAAMGGIRTGTAETPLRLALSTQSDATAGLFIGERISARGEQVAKAKSVRVKLRGTAPSATMYVILIEKDGSAWSAAVPLKPDTSEPIIPLSDLKPGKWAAIPAVAGGPFPYWIESPKGKTTIDLKQVERVQFSLRRDPAAREAVNALVQVEGAWLQF